MESKKEIRKKVLKIRNELTVSQIEEKSSIIAKKLSNSKVFVDEENIFLYINYGSEVITRNLISYCISIGKNVACPKVLSDGEMEFYKISDVLDLEEGYKGILEPKEGVPFVPKTGVVIVPGVAFDKCGYRVGYGKGFYDRYLSKHPEYKTVGLAFSCQIIDTVPHQEHDVKVMEIITE